MDWSTHTAIQQYTVQYTTINHVTRPIPHQDCHEYNGAPRLSNRFPTIQTKERANVVPHPHHQDGDPYQKIHRRL